MSEKPNALHVAGLRWALDTHLIGDLVTRQHVEALIAEASPAPSAEVEAVEVVARLLTWRGPRHQPVPHGGICARHYAEYPENHYPDGPWAEGEPLMTVAQHQRIVAAQCSVVLEAANERLAAKDAEIARLAEEADRYRNERDAWIERATELQGGGDELRAQLAAKQAAVPVAYLRESDLERLKPGHVAGCAASLNKEPAPGYVAIYAAPAAPQQSVVMPDKRELATQVQRDCCLVPGATFYNAAEHSWDFIAARLNADRSAQGEKP